MRLDTLASTLGARLVGPADRVIERVAALDEAGPAALVALFHRRYLPLADHTAAGAAIVTPAFEAHVPTGCARLIVDDARNAWNTAIGLLHPRPSLSPPPVGVDARASVHPEAIVHPTARIGPFVVVDAGARIDAEARVQPFAHVGPEARIGEGATLCTRATVLDRCVVEAGAWIGPGAVIGSVGFGLHAGRRLPHVGIAIIEAGATIGALSCVDRATVGRTVIGRGAHLDNLVQVGHNARVGAGAVLCGQVGLAGGARVEPGVVIGGQAGVAGHVTVGSGVRLAAQSGVTRDLKAPGDYSGHPAEPNRARLRRVATLKRLADPEAGS